jgi:rhodanese-related sulfurtransferase
LDAVNDQLFEQGTFIDVRSPKAHRSCAPKGFLNIPFYDIIDDGVAVPNDKPIYLCCDYGYKSSKVAKFLESKGYKNVNVIEGIGFYLYDINLFSRR